MQLRMWSYDLAREQAPTLDHLRDFMRLTEDAGYNAFGLYMEHRFAYPSTPWAHAKGCVTPEMVKTLQEEFPNTPIIPFINLLGHFEGMIYTEHGKRYREALLQGMQACPCSTDFIQLCETLVDETIQIFDSEIIHIGGDETWQLGQCEICKAKVERDNALGKDGKAMLYGSHFGPLAHRVLQKGRRPAVWHDMVLEHPAALEFLPKETLIFDWQYFNNCTETSRQFKERGFDVVCCPSIHTYNSVWCHLPQSEQNVADAVASADEVGAYGVCVTTWECGLMGSYGTILPAIKAAGEMLGNDNHQSTIANLQSDSPSPNPSLIKSPTLTREGNPENYFTLTDAPQMLAAYAEVGESDAEWARLMSVELPKVGGVFGFSKTRSSLKVRLLLNANPFLCWMHHHEELCGLKGDEALAILDRAAHFAPNPSMRGITEFVKLTIDFVRFAEQARQAYAQGIPGVAVASLAPCRQVFEHLEKVAMAANINWGGSLADIERCRIAHEHVERVIKRIRDYGDGSLGYLPAFEILTHPKFVPHDQASWWLINRWANE
ncbi:MAG: family 20 glycosylhydrolase [Fimbriimonadaceae bacterium]|nr:family 20 glycosylhydrolase [Fimbriimonadaceae bacterium]